MREKVGKSRNTVFFQWFGAPEGRKVGSLKRRVRSQLARWEMKKLHAVVARSTFPSQNVQSTPFSDHFWKLRCRKSARRCGAKHISKSKCYKAHQVRTTFGSWDVEKVHTVVARSTFPSQNVQNTPGVGPLLEVEMSKKCTPLWREAHFQVKMYKTPQLRTTFGSCHVVKVHAVVARSTFSKSKCTNHHMFAPLLEVRMLKKCTSLWREAHFEVKMYKTPHVRATFWRFGCWKSARRCGAKHISKSKYTRHTHVRRHFWRFGCWKSARRCGAKHISKSKWTKHHMFATTFGSSDVEKVHVVVARSTFRSQNAENTPASDHFWKLRCRKSACRCSVKMYKTLGVRTTFWRFRCRFASRHYTTGHSTTLHSSTLHYTTLHSSTLHYTKLHYTTLHYTEWHYNTDRQVDS